MIENGTLNELKINIPTIQLTLWRKKKNVKNIKHNGTKILG